MPLIAYIDMYAISIHSPRMGRDTLSGIIDNKLL